MLIPGQPADMNIARYVAARGAGGRRVYGRTVIAPDVNSLNYEFDGIAFTGVFDGNDHKIMNLAIDDGEAGHWYIGLFGYIVDGQSASSTYRTYVESCQPGSLRWNQQHH